ncbi:MAG: response regulator [Phycisphaeraceae bacterium]|nr:response regulator [Phycisphaeraceae bacterium]
MSVRILLADDEAHITHLVARRLEALGYEVLVACDGEEALHLATEHAPDLIVTDLQMPYLSGLDVATRLRQTEAGRDIPIIMLTARGYALSTEQVAPAQITEMHSKPFSVRRLVERIEHLLRERGAASGGAQRNAA